MLVSDLLSDVFISSGICVQYIQIALAYTLDLILRCIKSIFFSSYIDKYTRIRRRSLCQSNLKIFKLTTLDVYHLFTRASTRYITL